MDVATEKAKLSNRDALRRIGLSALKAFVSSVLAVLIANQSNLVNGSWTAAKGIAVSAIIAGLDAALKVIQILLEAPPTTEATP